jgi:predicted nuclease with TOPRIM domain
MQSILSTFAEECTELLVRGIELKSQVYKLAKEHKPRFYRQTKTIFVADLVRQCDEFFDDMTRWRERQEQLQSKCKEKLAEAKKIDHEAKRIVVVGILNETKRSLSDELSALRNLVSELEAAVKSLTDIVRAKNGAR